MANLMPKEGDVLTLANARWAVTFADGRELNLLRLNEPAPEEPERPREFKPNAMTPEEVADELGIAPKTVREYCKTGQLKGLKVGQQWRILRSDNPMLALA